MHLKHSKFNLYRDKAEFRRSVVAMPLYVFY